MPYEEEEPPFVEPDPELDALASTVVDACFEVHKKLGPGLDESLYQAALCRELDLRSVPYQCQLVFVVGYKGARIGERRVDLLVAARLIVEIKAVESIAPLHKAQVLTYLKIANLKLGLLVNFNTGIFKDGIKRILNPRGR